MSGAVVLMYHRIGSGILPGREAGEELYAVAPETFEQQLELLQTNDTSPIGVEDCVQSARPLPPRAVAITFDDGNVSDHAFALGALRRRGLRAAFFVTPAWVGSPGYMSWSQVRELLAAGMTVGAHGLDHARLTTLGENALRDHLREASRVLAAELGEPPRWLALPGGFGGRREVRAARDAGFQHVLGSVPRLTHGAGEDPIPRFAVRRGDSSGAFSALVVHRTGARLRHWSRYAAVQGVRFVLGARNHERLRGRLAAIARSE